MQKYEKITGEKIISNFPALVNDFERDYLANGPHGCGDTLWTLSKAIAASMAKKVADPQRKTAPSRSTVSASGCNPVMVKIRRDIQADSALIERTAAAAEVASVIGYDKSGKVVKTDGPKSAVDGFNALIRQSVGDGLDIVQAVACALLEMGVDHATGDGWLSAAFAQRKLDKRVVIRDGDSAAWKDDDTTAIQQAFRAARDEVQNHRAVRSNPKSKYVYMQDMVEDDESGEIDGVYYRSAMYADIGGYMSSAYTGKDYGTANGGYVGDYTLYIEMCSAMARLHLPMRQKEILAQRLKGHGTKAIATHMGVKVDTIKTQLKRMRQNPTVEELRREVEERRKREQERRKRENDNNDR